MNTPGTAARVESALLLNHSCDLQALDKPGLRLSEPLRLILLGKKCLSLHLIIHALISIYVLVRAPCACLAWWDSLCPNQHPRCGPLSPYLVILGRAGVVLLHSADVR